MYYKILKQLKTFKIIEFFLKNNWTGNRVGFKCSSKEASIWATSNNNNYNLDYLNINVFDIYEKYQDYYIYINENNKIII